MKDYQKLAEKTSATNNNENCYKIYDNLINNSPQNIRLLHASMGMATEAAEFIDILKKHIFYGKELDAEHLEEEIGDLLWYIAEALNALGLDLDQVMENNIRKLRIRYKKKFTVDEAMNRCAEEEIKNREVGNV